MASREREGETDRERKKDRAWCRGQVPMKGAAFATPPGWMASGSTFHPPQSSSKSSLVPRQLPGRSNSGPVQVQFQVAKIQQLALIGSSSSLHSEACNASGVYLAERYIVAGDKYTRQGYR